MLRRIFAVCLIALSACSPRGELTLMPEAARVGTVESIFVATSRAEKDENDFWSSGRSMEARFARFDISLPPERETGSLNWPPKGRRPDPRKHMVATDLALYPKATDFRAALRKSLQARGRNDREAVIFVHGFNNTFAESLYRFAQLYHDLELPGTAVHYSWPSAGSVLGYAYDRDSALFARDGLEELLSEVTAAGAEKIWLIGHSMGGALAMETLRQLPRTGAVRQRLSGVILMSPDLDVDLFRRQAQRIGPLPQPFIVMTSRRDGALALSAAITGESRRLGNLQDPRPLEGLNVTLIETGAYRDGDAHFTAATSPTLIALLNRAGAINDALGRDERARIGLLPGAVLSVRGATQMVLDPVARWGEN